MARGTGRPLAALVLSKECCSARRSDADQHSNILIPYDVREESNDEAEQHNPRHNERVRHCRKARGYVIDLATLRSIRHPITA